MKRWRDLQIERAPTVLALVRSNRIDFSRDSLALRRLSAQAMLTCVRARPGRAPRRAPPDPDHCLSPRYQDAQRLTRSRNWLVAELQGV
jgi:hypothetical protein